EAPTEPAATKEGDGRIALTATRRTIAARMLQSHQTMPVAWMMVEADVTGLVALRDRLKDEFRQHEGAGLTYMPFVAQEIDPARTGRDHHDRSDPPRSGSDG